MPTSHTRLAAVLGLLILVFALPLARWAAYGWKHDEASYVLLVPFIVAYLVRQQLRQEAGEDRVGARSLELETRDPEMNHLVTPDSGLRTADSDSVPSSQLPASSSEILNPQSQIPNLKSSIPTPNSALSSLLSPLSFGALALLTLAAWPFAPLPTGKDANWNVVLPILAFVWSVLAVAAWQFGWSTLWKLRFPAFFLLLMVPVPTAAIDRFEVFLQYASAEAAHGLFVVAGIPLLRDGLVFQLPNITLQVAQECSGVRSTLVLLITSLLAGYLFLRRPWKKWFLMLVVLPLGVLRNGFRIVTIGWLCVNIDPSMIHSPIHHRGGPIFFALSLIPLFLLLLWLRRGQGESGARS